MEKNKIGIVTVGDVGKAALIAEQVIKQTDKEAVLLSPDNAYAETEKFIEHFSRGAEHRERLSAMYEGKQFKCKGKHQYRLVDKTNEEHQNGTIVIEVWQCECGKTL